MSSPDIVLCGPPFPVENTRSVWSIPNDPSFCETCCNLSPGSAYSLMPRPDIFVHETEIGVVLQKAKSLEPHYSINPIPDWAGSSRVDLTSW